MKNKGTLVLKRGWEMIYFHAATPGVHSKTPKNQGQTALALIRVTSGRPCHLFWLWSQFLLKNHVSLKVGINSTSFGPFQEFFFQKSPKKWRKLKIYQKIAKNKRKFRILYFLSYFNMQYLKRKHFSHRIQFHTGKV